MTVTVLIPDDRKPAPGSSLPALVTIAGDVRIYCEAIRAIVANALPHAAVRITTIVSEALATTSDVGVVILDGRSAMLWELLRRIRAGAHGPQVVVIGAGGNAQTLMSMAAAGVAGFLPADASSQQLVDAIQSMLRRSRYVPAGRVSVRRRQVPRSEPNSRGNRLTPRELEVLELIGRGLSNREIGAALHIELATVKNHVHNLLEKLNVRRRTEAIARLRDAGFVDRAGG
ncbi:MAG: response regulator transcription factor [Actinomycetota bacterium]